MEGRPLSCLEKTPKGPARPHQHRARASRGGGQGDLTDTTQPGVYLQRLVKDILSSSSCSALSLSFTHDLPRLWGPCPPPLSRQDFLSQNLQATETPVPLLGPCEGRQVIL